MERLIINQNPGDRVKEVLKRYGITQAELARRIPGSDPDGHTSPVFINSVIKGHKTLTPKLAEKIAAAFPGAGIRVSWLLGYDDLGMTDADCSQALFENACDYARGEFDKQMIIRKAMELLLQAQGATWDSRKVDYVYDPAPSVSIQGQAFTDADLDRIAHKMSDLLRLELDYAVMAKKACRAEA